MTRSPISHEKVFAALQRLSSGTYSTVYLKEDRNALKASNNLRMDAGLDGDVTNDEKNYNETKKNVLKRSELMEAMILMAISCKKHENLLSAEAIFLDSFVGQKQFSLLLELELAHGSLDNLILNQPLQFTGERKRLILKDITKGVAALHQMFGVCHGDLKPANILIRVQKDSQIWHACIADFGLSTLAAFAVHGHAAESYTFGYVPPECCDALQSAPFLIRDTKEANLFLSHISCFAKPVSGDFFGSNRDEISLQKSQESIICSTSNTAAVFSEKKSSLYCTESLDKTPMPTVHLSDFKTATPELMQNLRPQQANYATFENVTKVNLASDVWALGSIALFLTLSGEHPISKVYQIIMNSLPRLVQERIDSQLLHRMEMTFWFFALQEHQFSKDWQIVFDFEAVSMNFFKCFGIPLAPQLTDLNLLLCEKSVLESDFIYGCLQFLPDQRLSIETLCNHAYFEEKVSEQKETRSKKRSSDHCNLALPKKKILRSNKAGLLSLVFTRYLELGMLHKNNIQMPFHWSKMKLLVEICSKYKYSYQSLFLANAYIQLSANRIVNGTKDEVQCKSNASDNQHDVPVGWSEKNCKIHAVTCLLLAVSLFEPRHDAIVGFKDVVGDFGEQHNFSESEIAQSQRLLIDCLNFQFEVPTVATFIHLALLETKTTHCMPSELLCTELVAHLCDPDSKLFSCSQADLLALAMLKKYKCKEAFEHLLSITKRQKSLINELLSKL